MTKKVRIENADTIEHMIVVQIWQIGLNGHDDTLVSEQELPNPTDMCDSLVCADYQYLVIKEVT